MLQASGTDCGFVRSHGFRRVLAGRHGKGWVLTLTIEACDDMMDFRNATLMLTPTASSLKLLSRRPWAGRAGAGLSVYVDSDEEVPEVSFATPEIVVDETDSTSVYSLPARCRATKWVWLVMVTGDALISLFGDNVEAKVGCLRAVEFGDQRQYAADDPC